MLLGYLTLSFLFFGVRIAAHPERMVVGGLFTDPQIFVWSFAWWPHAILHGDNPFYTHAIWAPSGFNLAWATSVPALALVFVPLTLAFGPVLAYNVACLVVPALAAWAAFVLCRHITRRFWPSAVGGYLFGFSSYVLSAELTHINTAAVFTLPLAALLVLRFLEGNLSARALTVELAALLALQAYLSTELLFTLTLELGSALVLALAFFPPVRAQLVRLAIPLAGAFVLGAVLAAPLLYYALTGYDTRPPIGSEDFVADALNFVVPTRASLGGWWSAALAGHFPATDAERGAYLGLPSVAIVCWFALRRWRTACGRFLVGSLTLVALESLGSWLTVDGQRVVTLPWVHLASRPLFDAIMPVRLSVYTALAAGVIVAIWAASTSPRTWLRVVLAGLAVLAVVPNLTWGAWARTPAVPSLFTTGLYRSCLGHGENVMLLPFGPLGDSLFWQVDSRFWFRVAGGYISPAPPPPFTEPHSIEQIAASDLPPKVTARAVAQFARLKGVTAIVLDAREEPIWRPVLARLAHPQAVGGALIYRLSGGTASSPGCSRARASARSGNDVSAH